MKIDTMKLGLSCAAASAVLWIICSLFVFAVPQMMMNVSGHMVHADLQTVDWTLSPFGVFFGLAAWAAVGGSFGWLVAFFYNRFILSRPEKD